MFDGVCNLCNAFVRFLIRNDPKELLQFSSLQGKFAQQLIVEQKIKPSMDSVVFYVDGNAFVKSDAVFQIIIVLGGFWRMFLIFKFLPASWLDVVYDFVARNRYQWFGKKSECVIPSPQLQKRFID